MSSFRRRLMTSFFINNEGGEIPPKEYITFSDSEVERICIENWSSDGIGFTLEDAMKVSDLKYVFMSNTAITRFDELKHFVNLKKLNGSNTSYNNFGNCENLQEITLPESLVSIGKYDFYKCLKLQSINIDNIEFIDISAFNGCSLLNIALTNENIKTISNTTFSNCVSLQQKINMPNLEVLGSGAFYNSGIIEVSNIGKISELKGSNVKAGTFGECLNLEKVVLPDTLTSMYRGEFYNCKKLKTLILESIVPPTFDYINLETCSAELKIYVPDESVETYKIHEKWSTYADKIHSISEYL